MLSLRSCSCSQLGMVVSLNPKYLLIAWLIAVGALVTGNAPADGHSRSLYDTLHTKRGERVMAKVICENPNKWYVERTACNDN